MKKKKHIIRLLISLFLAFHCFGILLSPNPNSFAYRSLANIYRPYLETLGLGYTWGFFAPEPVTPPLYIDYELERENAMPIHGRFPPEKNPHFFRDRYNRAMSVGRLMASSDDHLKNMFMNYLCHLYPDGIRAKLWRVIGMQPSLEDVQKGKRKMTDSAEYHIDVLGTYYCPEKNP